MSKDGERRDGGQRETWESVLKQIPTSRLFDRTKLKVVREEVKGVKVRGYAVR
jgi:hypothetical protein